MTCESSSFDASQLELVDSPSQESPPPQTTSPSSMVCESSNFDAIQIELKNCISYIKMGLVLDGFDILSKITDAVVNNCEMLGLTSSENPHNIDRLAFWKGLNHTWLFSISRIPVVHSDTQRLTLAHLVHLRSTIVSWGNTLMRYGLIDYELGLWEGQLLDGIDLALRLFNPTTTNKIAATPNQIESPGYNYDNSQPIVKLEEENQEVFYHPCDAGLSADNEQRADEEDSSHLAASAILTQLYNLINDPHANSHESQEPTSECPPSHEMSPESNISPDQHQHQNSPAQLEQSTDS
ncbi:hypothetical protein DSO57_1033341 [Entomophthora muscae]|uniref:Uncharacterized protein n=1 Tax=Entomophthora muscae TaxID=34485 RepID=A0ACC2S217_9FUNG|nr:hypothetical protein DSO57_1033341 [Entomophthora muscae]